MKEHRTVPITTLELSVGFLRSSLVAAPSPFTSAQNVCSPTARGPVRYNDSIYVVWGSPSTPPSAEVALCIIPLVMWSELLKR